MIWTVGAQSLNRLDDDCPIQWKLLVNLNGEENTFEGEEINPWLYPNFIENTRMGIRCDLEFSQKIANKESECDEVPLTEKIRIICFEDQVELASETVICHSDSKLKEATKPNFREFSSRGLFSKFVLKIKCESK